LLTLAQALEELKVTQHFGTDTQTDLQLMGKRAISILLLIRLIESQ
jgi:hypothetical protein